MYVFPLPLKIPDLKLIQTDNRLKTELKMELKLLTGDCQYHIDASLQSLKEEVATIDKNSNINKLKDFTEMIQKCSRVNHPISLLKTKYTTNKLTERIHKVEKESQLLQRLVNSNEITKEESRHFEQIDQEIYENIKYLKL